MIIRTSLILLGIILLLTMRYTEGSVTRLIELFSFCKADASLNTDYEEDDILNNRSKWRMIITGYVIFVLFAVFAVASIFTKKSTHCMEAFGILKKQCRRCRKSVGVLKSDDSDDTEHLHDAF